MPFCTHEGSGLSALQDRLILACPYSDVRSGLAIYGTDAQGDPDKVTWTVDHWLSGLGY